MGRRTRDGALTVAAAVAVACVLRGAALALRGFTAPPPAWRGLRRHASLTGGAATSPAAASSGATACPVTGRSPEAVVEDARKLLQDVTDIALTTGFQTGFTRATEAARAVALTSAELFREPPTELNDAFAARLLRKLFERLGATYVKLGQFIASSPTVFPAEFVREFQQCLDSTVTVPFSEVRRIVEDDLGKPMGTVYSFVDPEPLASASIAQVHAATLTTGEEVVIKVQKPGIEEILRTDLGFVYITARVLEFINPELNSRGSLADIASDLRTSMLGELDFRQEQQNLVIFREFLTAKRLNGAAVAPRPFPEASSRRVLTMERLRGVPLVDLEGIQRYSADPEATLVAALNTWALSVQACEFFHADVHAGNLLVLEDGRVGFLDFGIVGRMPPAMSTAIDALNDALANGDAKGMARALISMGATVGEVDETSFAADIEKLLTRLGSAEGVAEGSTSIDESQIQDVVLDIAQVAGNNGLKLPREFGLLIKQSLYFDRFMKLLAPDLDMMSDSRIASFGAQPSTEAEVAKETEVVEAAVVD